MITITALSGPHAGKVREGYEPQALLSEFARHDWKWRVDFLRATEAELLSWGHADMLARIMAALVHGRHVEFAGMAYSVDADASPETVMQVVGELEDAIADSGYMVRVERDDEEGVVIGAGGTEHRVQ